jgi:hypothetical protein
MSVPDEMLRAAMADASTGKGVIVLTPTATETDIIVARAKSLTVEGLKKFAKASTQEALNFFTVSSIPWQLKLRSNGWVFFVPGTDLKPYDDVGSPAYIYSPGPRGTYQRLSYAKWRSENMPPAMEPSPDDGIEIPKTAWNHLMEDDD